MLVERSGQTGSRGAGGDSREIFASSYGRGDPVGAAAVDDAHDDLEKIPRELIKRHGEAYRIVSEVSTVRGLERRKDVALVLADQWMPGANGMEFLARAGGWNTSSSGSPPPGVRRSFPPRRCLSS